MTIHIHVDFNSSYYIVLEQYCPYLFIFSYRKSLWTILKHFTYLFIVSSNCMDSFFLTSST